MYVSTLVRWRVNSIFEKRFRCTKCFGAWCCSRRGRGGKFYEFLRFYLEKFLNVVGTECDKRPVHGWESESEKTSIRLECTSLQSRNRVAYETADRPLGRSCFRGEWGLPERYISSSAIATTVTVHAGLAIESSFNFLKAINRVLSLFLQTSSSIRAVANSG